MYSVRSSSKPSPGSGSSPQHFPLGAAVRLRRGEVTGIVTGYPSDIDRVQVLWDDTGEVTYCLKANLVEGGQM
jgi:hypothetical protein